MSPSTVRFLVPFPAVPVVAFGGTLIAIGPVFIGELWIGGDLGWLLFLWPFAIMIGTGIGIVVAGGATLLRLAVRGRPDRRMIAAVYFAATAVVLFVGWMCLTTGTQLIGAIVVSLVSAGVSTATAAFPLVSRGG